MKRETSMPFVAAMESVPGRRTCATIASIAKNLAAPKLTTRFIALWITENALERILLCCRSSGKSQDTASRVSDLRALRRQRDSTSVQLNQPESDRPRWLGSTP